MKFHLLLVCWGRDQFRVAKSSPVLSLLCSMLLCVPGSEEGGRLEGGEKMGSTEAGTAAQGCASVLSSTRHGTGHGRHSAAVCRRMSKRLCSCQSSPALFLGGLDAMRTTAFVAPHLVFSLLWVIIFHTSSLFITLGSIVPLLFYSHYQFHSFCITDHFFCCANPPTKQTSHFLSLSTATTQT